MNIKASVDLRYLLLIPPLFLSSDFLPLWFTVLYSVALGLISFFKPFQVFSYLNFMSIYFVFKTQGLTIIPETMVALLGVFLISTFIKNKKTMHFEMYPVFLWVGAFALFSSNLYYLLYTCFIFLIIFLSQTSQKAFSLKSVFKNLWAHKRQLSITILISTFLFIFFPRFYHFLPTANISRSGKIGYSKSIENSTTSQLQLSSQSAFFASLSTKINPEYLYWRGRVHVLTDGYNWKSTEMAPISHKAYSNKKESNPLFLKEIKQTLKYEQDFNGDIILLDSPLRVLDTNLNVYRVSATNEFRSSVKKKKSIVTAVSTLSKLQNRQLRAQNKLKYLQLPSFIPKILKAFVQELKGTRADEIVQSFKQKLLVDNYQYTLSPGNLSTMGSFIKAKLGYCSHFASLMGIALRLKGIPTRLVSGFQGGKYNEVGEFYEIKSNDAHVWVEYYSKGSWIQADPTSYVSPSRIRLGGEDFLNPKGVFSMKNKSSFIFGVFSKARQYVETLNYRVGLFLDNYDRGEQRKLSKKLKMSIKAFSFFGLGIVLMILILYYVFIKASKKTYTHPADLLLLKLDKKLKSYKINLSSQVTIDQMKKISRAYHNPKLLEEFLITYQKARYGNNGERDKIILLKSILEKVK